jgi:hypothetical protein
MSSDLTFITNESGETLRDRFEVLLGDDTRFFDCLVGYFFTSGFHKLNRIPIPKPPTQSLERITKLVATIIGKKERDCDADTTALEREIDELVYALYGLTPEEIQLVEERAKK